MQNEPNSSIADWIRNSGGTPALWPSASGLARRLCETNPICRAYRAKRTQFPATPDGTRPEGRGTQGQSCETKPICWVDRAKRTQFPAAEIPHHSHIPLFQRSNPMPIVRNKANCPLGRCRARTPNPRRAERLLCETKPISGRPGPRECPIVRNEANLPRRIGNGRGRPGLGGPAGDRLCETNPISATMPIGRSAFPGGGCAKQSQWARMPVKPWADFVRKLIDKNPRFSVY